MEEQKQQEEKYIVSAGTYEGGLLGVSFPEFS
jgi:hypothetical protein